MGHDAGDIEAKKQPNLSITEPHNKTDSTTQYAFLNDIDFGSREYPSKTTGIPIFYLVKVPSTHVPSRHDSGSLDKDVSKGEHRSDGSNYLGFLS